MGESGLPGRSETFQSPKIPIEVIFIYIYIYIRIQIISRDVFVGVSNDHFESFVDTQLMLSMATKIAVGRRGASMGWCHIYTYIYGGTYSSSLEHMGYTQMVARDPLKLGITDLFPHTFVSKVGFKPPFRVVFFV